MQPPPADLQEHALYGSRRLGSASFPFPSLSPALPLPFWTVVPAIASRLGLPQAVSNLHCWARLSHRNTTVGGFLSFLLFLLPLQLSLLSVGEEEKRARRRGEERLGRVKVKVKEVEGKGGERRERRLVVGCWTF